MRRFLVIVVLVALLVTLLAAAPALSKRKNVQVGDNWFVRAGDPPTVTVQRNDTVAWQWDGANPHNVKATRGPVKFESKIKTAGTYRKKMGRRGTYRIVCELHPPDMRMRLRVR